MKNVKQQTKQTSFVKDGTVLYELVGDENLQQFLKYAHIPGTFDLVDDVEINEILHIPPQNDLVASGTIVLATYPQEYGSVKALFQAIKRFIYKYVDLPEEYLVISSLYAMLTWVFDQFDVLPYMRVIGDFGTGKSRYLLVLGSLCYRACFAGGATTVSPIFRIIELYGGVTLVFDEADFRFSSATTDMVKILNTGYMKGMPVLRTEGDGNNRRPVSYNTYGPKVIATRSNFDDLALESRCLTQIMGGKPRKDIPRHLPKSFKQESEEIRNKLLMFRLKNYFDIKIDPSLEVDGLDSRINQIALPILSIIDDPEVLVMVQGVLKKIQGKLNVQKQDQDPALVLRAIINLIKGGSYSIEYKHIATEINSISGNKSDYTDTLTPAKIGRVNRSNLDISTYKSGGITKIEYSQNNIKKIQQLANKYSITEVGDVDLVELCFGVEKDVLGEKFTQEIGEALC